MTIAAAGTAAATPVRRPSAPLGHAWPASGKTASAIGTDFPKGDMRSLTKPRSTHRSNTCSPPAPPPPPAAQFESP